jgi:nucleoside 2-deoxyribosyltransferase
MRKYFVAFRLTGEAPEVLKERLSLVVAALRAAGIDAYCNFFDPEIDKQHLTPRQIMDKAFARIDASDGLFALVASSDKSAGQLVEVGYALAKNKHVIAAIQQDVATVIENLAHKTIRWQDLADLKTQLEGLDQ